MDIASTIKELSGLLTILPPVEFCCVYGSTLHPNNHDKSRMVDYILGVRDPVQWHSENLKINRHHYASWIPYLGGAKLVNDIADEIGVGVHFNPFVSWDDKNFKYGVVRMHDLVQDVLHWEKFYLSGRLQKPVHILVDSLDIGEINSSNLRAATSAALLLLPSRFCEEDLYAKICSLSYEGDLRMLFAEDRNKVKRIVEGQLDLFRIIYKPTLEELATKDFLRQSFIGDQKKLSQDCSLVAAQSLVSFLPSTVKSQMIMKLGGQEKMRAGRVTHEVAMRCREEAVECMRKILKRKVMVSSVRQAVSGLLTTGGARALRYLSYKVSKAWKSWT